MLRPARSLGIVRLPAGLDPDDLIKQQGKAAMESLLAQPQSLLDALWQFERDAQPLTTPEDKAGLKARLLAHVDQIEDQDIRALYRRELMQLFSDFAFPPRPQRDWRPGGVARPVTPRMSGDVAAQLRKALAGGARDALTQAVIHGLLHHPREIIRHSDALGRLAQFDPKTTNLIESLFEVAETLDSRANMAISVLQGLPAPPDKQRYAFLREGTDPGDARAELAEAVTLLVERPALKAALAAAGARFDKDPEGAFAEQTRLRERLNELDERLKHFGRSKAARSAAGENFSSLADGAGE
jgi:DNA primase